MAEHKRVNEAKKGDEEQRHRTKRQDSQPLFEKSLAWDTKPLSLTETPFHPRISEHATILSRIPFSAQRHEFIMRLHQTYGNRYVQRLLNSKVLQAKLNISQPGDIYEQEADRVADVVTRVVNSQIQRQPEEEEEEVQAKPLFQRQAEPEEEEEPIQTKTIADIQRQPEEEEEPIQTKAFLGTQRQELPEEELQAQLAESQETTIQKDLEKRINSARSGGQSLSENVRSNMEAAFGVDFSSVRVHTDSEADVMNKQLGALAFTTGHDVFFREGEYNPSSDSGEKLIAHELTHVVQQRNRGEQLQRELTDEQILTAATGVVRMNIMNLDKIPGLSLEYVRSRGILWNIPAKERGQEGVDWNWDDAQDVKDEAVEYARLFRGYTDYYELINMMEGVTGERGRRYCEQLRSMKFGPSRHAPAPRGIVFGPCESKGFYEGKSHTIQIDIYKHQDALEVLDTLLFESINAARTAELNEDIEGVKEYGTDVRYVALLLGIWNAENLYDLCRRVFGLEEYMVEADEDTCLQQKGVPMPTYEEVSFQAARQALWHWKTEGWKEENRKNLWGKTPHALGMEPTERL
jgi:hypothetical protein